MEPTRISDLETISIPPHRWQGERSCVVGPFSCREVTDAFATAVLACNYVQVGKEDVFTKRNVFYIRVSA